MVTADDYRIADHELDYSAEVIEWLSTGYGIDFRSQHVPELNAGRSFTVDYDGQPTSVSVQLTPAGDLSLVDQQQTVLPMR